MSSFVLLFPFHQSKQIVSAAMVEGPCYFNAIGFSTLRGRPATGMAQASAIDYVRAAFLKERP